MACACHPSVENASRRCPMHAAIYAKAAMEKQGWVCINEYGNDVAQAVDAKFLDTVAAVQLAGVQLQLAGVQLQRWMAGWDAKREVPIYGIWAPRPVAAILAVCEGKLKRDDLAQVLKESKINVEFVQALDAAWRLAGHAAVIAIIIDHLPHIAAEINRSVGG